jgi:hypothetical protein
MIFVIVYKVLNCLSLLGSAGLASPFLERNSDRVVRVISLGAILGSCLSNFRWECSTSASRGVSTQSGICPDWICKVALTVVTLKLEVIHHERLYDRLGGKVFLMAYQLERLLSTMLGLARRLAVLGLAFRPVDDQSTKLTAGCRR